jgi:hypothetical protein
VQSLVAMGGSCGWRDRRPQLSIGELWEDVAPLDMAGDRAPCGGTAVSRRSPLGE